MTMEQLAHSIGMTVRKANGRAAPPKPRRPRSGGSPGTSGLVIGAFLAALALGGSFSNSSSRAGDAPQNPSEYRLDAMDKVRLKVFEWRPSRDEVYEWAALNDMYVIGVSGRLSLPMIGEVAASGLSTSELAQSIGERMKARIGLADIPNISVEVVQYRPFYILGRVDHPGEFSYRPNLNVLQAISIAGGLQRRIDAASRLEREAITGRGDVELLTMEKVALLARRARLQAELSNAGEIDFPKSLDQDDETIRLIIQQERSIHASRDEALKAQIAPLENLKGFLDAEVKSLLAQIAAHKAEEGLANEDLSTVKKLVAKGLAVQPRRLASQRIVYQLEADGLRLESSLMRARQEISKTDFTISELRGKGASEITAGLRATQAKLDEAARKLATSRMLLADTSDAGLLSLGGDGDSGSPQLILTIVRSDGGRSVEISATETTEVRPGDTVKVELASAAVARAGRGPYPSAPASAPAPAPPKKNDGRGVEALSAPGGPVEKSPIAGGEAPWGLPNQSRAFKSSSLNVPLASEIRNPADMPGICEIPARNASLREPGEDLLDGRSEIRLSKLINRYRQ